MDDLYNATFGSVEYKLAPEQEESLEESHTLQDVSEASFRKLGTDSPKVIAALIEAIGTDKWQSFQAQVSPIKLRLTRLQTRLEEVKNEELSAIRAARAAEERALTAEESARLQEQQGPLKLA